MTTKPAPLRRVLVTTFPFGEVDRRPLDLLEAAGIDYDLNLTGRRLREDELIARVPMRTAIIAGTESLNDRVLAAGTDLALIARVGIGLDSVDMDAARRLGITVTYTPDAPSAAVAEMTIGLMIDLLRHITAADRDIRNRTWRRYLGRRLADSLVGVIGCGRIGGQVIRHLLGGFPGVRILANDLPPVYGSDWAGVEWASKDAIFERADVVTVHVPLTPTTRNLVTARQLSLMRPDSVIINTSRGEIIDETDLANALRRQQIAGAALDVFAHEPYGGDLLDLDTCLLTAHMGSMAADCRRRMELEATLEVIRFFSGEPLHSVVPDSELQG